MKNILLLAHDDAGQEARLQAALDLTRALDGHLFCLDIVQTLAPGGHFAIAAEAALMEEEWEREKLNREQLNERLTGEDVRWNITSTSGELAPCVREASALADLTVINRKLDSSRTPDMLAVVSAVVLEARRPVVAVPEQCRGFDVGGRAVVAWDGSLPAKAALVASVPLLKLASRIDIVEVQGASSGSVDEAATYLSRHDVHAEIDLVARLSSESNDLGAVIIDVCRNMSAAYCVMGLYGHSRLREALFGGVSRHMLTNSEIPLFLAH